MFQWSWKTWSDTGYILQKEPTEFLDRFNVEWVRGEEMMTPKFLASTHERAVLPSAEMGQVAG